MCGIAGLFLKNRALEPELGSHLANMLAVLTDRGPDSAGFAIYGQGNPARPCEF
jgi:glutamate synthase domain-containing protein 1